MVKIPKGTGLKKIASTLQNSGIIGNDKLFILYVMSEDLQDKLKAGEYEFKEGSTMAEVVR